MFLKDVSVSVSGCFFTTLKNLGKNSTVEFELS